MEHAWDSRPKAECYSGEGRLIHAVAAEPSVEVDFPRSGVGS
jgi:hypothetical protein